MKLKIYLVIYTIITLVLIATPFVKSASLPPVEAGECIELSQTCDNCTFINITTIRFPNSTIALNDLVMTQDGTEYNYSFCDTRTLGTYTYKTEGDPDGLAEVESITFEVTGTGFEFTQARSTFYTALLIILMFLFVISLFAVSKLPTKDATDEFGVIISINHLKYLRPVILIIVWVILLSIVFTSSNIAIAYLGSNMFGNLLFTIYQLMFWITIPAVFIVFIFIFVQIFRDREVKSLIERGVDIQGKP
jgi:uncharacterized membrane protein YhdT